MSTSGDPGITVSMSIKQAPPYPNTTLAILASPWITPLSFTNKSKSKFPDSFSIMSLQSLTLSSISAKEA